jgi:glutamine amidotransferase
VSISIIDYGVCNASSVQNMLNRLGYPCRIIRNPKEVEKDNKLILPGIGSFDNGMKNLNKLCWDRYFKNEFNLDKQYLLGFCLGMQVLLKNSEEGSMDGLNLISGKVRRLQADSNQKIPNMGWRSLQIINSNFLTNTLTEQDKFYFVHSYYCDIEKKNQIIALSNHVKNFPAIIQKNKIIGCQFHPEKSNIYGMKILESFAQI